MASNIYEFKSLNNLLDFVKPLIAEGYPVAINIVPGKFPREYTTEKFLACIGEKGNQFRKEELSNGNR